MTMFESNLNYKKPLELECSDVIYNCIIMVVTPNIYLAKRQIIENVINANLNYDIQDFKPYKSRLELNIPLLKENVRHHLYSLLNQFYDVRKNREYLIAPYSQATHEDVNELVTKITDILSNKLIGKDIVKQIEPINSYIQFF